MKHAGGLAERRFSQASRLFLKLFAKSFWWYEKFLYLCAPLTKKGAAESSLQSG